MPKCLKGGGASSFARGLTRLRGASDRRSHSAGPGEHCPSSRRTQREGRMISGNLRSPASRCYDRQRPPREIHTRTVRGWFPVLICLDSSSGRPQSVRLGGRPTASPGKPPRPLWDSRHWDAPRLAGRMADPNGQANGVQASRLPHLSRPAGPQAVVLAGALPLGHSRERA